MTEYNKEYLGHDKRGHFAKATHKEPPKYKQIVFGMDGKQWDLRRKKKALRISIEKCDDLTRAVLTEEIFFKRVIAIIEESGLEPPFPATNDLKMQTPEVKELVKKWLTFLADRKNKLDDEKQRLTDVDPRIRKDLAREKFKHLFANCNPTLREKLTSIIIENFCLSRLHKKVKSKWDKYLGPKSVANILRVADMVRTKNHTDENLTAKTNKWLETKSNSIKRQDVVLRNRIYDFKQVFDSRARELAKFDYGQLRGQFKLHSELIHPEQVPTLS